TTDENNAPEIEKKRPAKEERKNENTSMRHRYSPVVLTLAQEHQIDLKSIAGTGFGGRITRKDMYHHIEQRKQGVESKVVAGKEEQSYLDTTNKNAHTIFEEGYELTGVRKAIADKMVLSTTEIPHAWMT